MKFEAVIFDLDGTLLASMDIWEQIDMFLPRLENNSITERFDVRCSNCKDVSRPYSKQNKSDNRWRPAAYVFLFGLPDSYS